MIKEGKGWWVKPKLNLDDYTLHCNFRVLQKSWLKSLYHEGQRDLPLVQGSLLRSSLRKLLVTTECSNYNGRFVPKLINMSWGQIVGHSIEVYVAYVRKDIVHVCRSFLLLRKLLMKLKYFYFPQQLSKKIK